MKYVIFVFLGLWAIDFCGRLIIAIIRRKRAKESYQIVKLAYEGLLLTRHRYYLSKYIDDEKERENVQKICTEKYQNYLDMLSDPTNLEDIDFLTDEERKDLEKTLSLPRYELF